MSRGFWVFLVLSLAALQLDCRSGAAGQAPEGGTAKTDDHSASAPDSRQREPASADQAAKEDAKSDTEKTAPRNPASTRELLSDDTVEYLKQAGKKVEGLFEPLNKK